MTPALATGEDVLNALADVAAAQERLAALPVDGLTATEVLHVLDVRQKLAWADAAVDHKLITRLQECGPDELGGDTVAKVLTHRLRIPAEEARQRVADAEVLGPRRAMTGEVLEPVLPN
ncbi:DUF222 domain-containing protein, partial [Mycobacterium sp. ACS4331]|uniref:DUF222 domain-containing protein n=1 Tax=Mycobacterium sp. ACS4331 TaxID=1834121 RepID=UPI000A7C2EFF